MLKNSNLYCVGGYIRDEILGIKNFDIDYCYQGNAIEFAQKNFNVIKENTAFGTVKVLTSDNQEIDIASTREERYPRKGHLPEVFNIGCPLESDLKRRDFTINTLARCTKDSEKIVDIFDGQGDIKAKKLRILHDNSFIDDPSRIIRGLKFSVRFDFELEDKTQALQERYLENINYDVSYHRLKKELVETFSLNKQAAYEKFIEQKIYKLLGKDESAPDIRISIEKLINETPCKHVWLVYLGLFDLSNFELTRQEKRIIEWSKRLRTEKHTNNTPVESLLLNKLYFSAI